jgi:SAM-dependent methyltransferase
MGLAMTGVDLTGGFIRRAKAAARRLPLRQRKMLRFIRQDMRRIDFDGEFDAAINWFSSFGYFTDRENLAYCRRVLKSLKPGGQFLVEVLNKSYMLRHLHSGYEQTINGVRIANKPKWDAHTGRMRDTWTMSRGGRTEIRRLSMRVYTGGEMRELLRSAGFTNIRLWGHSRKGAQRMTRHARRFIVVGWRPVD